MLFVLHIHSKCEQKWTNSNKHAHNWHRQFIDRKLNSYENGQEMIELIKFAYTKLSLFYSTLSSKATESKQAMSKQKLEEEEYGTEDAID